MTSHLSRRSFIKNTAATAGALSIGSTAIAKQQFSQDELSARLPREVWIASISQMGLRASTSEAMITMISEIIDSVAVFKPDIICLPEAFSSENIDESLTLTEKLAKAEIALQQFSIFAKKHSCYIICPVYILKEEKTYNSAVIFDRSGNRLGEYLKAFLPKDELKLGLTPGPIQPPVFKTDFGLIGIQICYDIFWNTGWEELSNLGAEIVFWPSAFAGGRRVNAKAWDYKYFVVSSTRNISKICDVNGEQIASTGIWDRNFICAPVNLEKVLVTTWPYVNVFNEIRQKYGRRVKITTSHEEEWSVIESLSADVFIKDILNEFSIKSYHQDILEAEMAQTKTRTY